MKYLRSIPFILVVACTACVVLGQLGEVLWFFDNFSAFYLQYFLILILFFGYMIGTKNLVGVIFLIFPLSFLLFTIVDVPAYTPTHTVENGYRIMHANVLYSNTQYNLVRTEIEQHNPDIIILQEADEVWENKLHDVIERYPFGINMTDQKFSSVIMRSKIPTENILVYEDFFPPVVEFVYRDFSLLSAHPLAPVSKFFWTKRNEQVKQLGELLESRTEPIVLIGDHNITEYSPYFTPLDKYHVNTQRENIHMTWPAFFSPMGIAIDHVFSNFAVRNVQTGNYTGSDHYPLIIDLQ